MQRSKSTMGRRNRIRGQEAERKIERDFTQAGATFVEKSREYHRGKTWDVMGEIGRNRFYVQSKRRKRWDFLKKLVKNMETSELNVIHFSVDYMKEDVVVIRWSDFLKLIQGKTID